MNIYSMISPEERAALKKFEVQVIKKPQGLRGYLREMGVNQTVINYARGPVKALLTAWMEPEDIFVLSQAITTGEFKLAAGVMEVTA